MKSYLQIITESVSDVFEKSILLFLHQCVTIVGASVRSRPQK